MRTSRSALNRLLDEQHASLTLITTAGKAVALRKKLIYKWLRRNQQWLLFI
jgi:hypothetical protein